MSKDFPRPNFYDEQTLPKDKRVEAITGLAQAFGMQDGDVVVVILEKKETGDYKQTIAYIQKAQVKTPVSTLRTVVMDMVNKHLKPTKGGV
jgi:hypothetical protein